MDSRTGLPVVGMVGGGQVARMTHRAAIALGQSLRVLCDRPDDTGAMVVPEPIVGAYADLDTLRRFAAGCDVITLGDACPPDECLRALAADGHTILPGPDALRYSRDRQAMYDRLGRLGLSTTRASAGTGRRLAAVVARSPFGQVAAYPLVETVRQDGVWVETIAPAPGVSDECVVTVQAMAIRIAVELAVVGLLVVGWRNVGGELVVEHLAMRPHAAAHWTIEGARTSQFEQHLRAVLDYPMGGTAMTAPIVVTASVRGGEPGGLSLDERLHHMFAAEPTVKAHLYGRQVRPGLDIGHVTALGDDVEAVRASAARACHWLRFGQG